MKTFKNPDCTIEFGIGKGAGHDHLCVRINGESLFYAHVIAHPMNLDGKDVSVSFWECVDENDMSSTPILWKNVHGDLHLKSF